MKKTITIILFAIFTLFAFKTINAYEIGDPDDVFYVNAPGANQKVSGTINISWRMWDDDQSSIQYTAKLFDAASCENVNYGTINSNLNGSSNKNQDNVLLWNTNNTLSSSNLPDGNYCLQLCAAMKNGSTPYSACNSRIVKIVNHNSLPVITSNPTNLTIKESGSWNYQVTAYDADNDPLTYNLVYSTSFLTINSQTGYLQTNGNSKALPSGVNQADYKIVVSVSDGVSGSTNQEFTIHIVRDNPIVNPPDSNNPEPTTPEEPVEPTDEEINHPTKIEILYPTDNSILKGSENAIKWDITDQDGLSKISLEYSRSKNKDWKLIKTLSNQEEVAFNTYNWDVSNIEDGIYYLKITVTDKKNSEVNRISDNFLIKNQDNETQSQPLIINLQPESNSELKQSNPKLSADFVASNGGKVLTNTVKILLNDVDITEKCNITEENFFCEINQNLEDGKHSINVTYKDSNDKIASLNWTFTINTKPQDQTLTQDTIVILGRELPKNSLVILIGLCCVLLILLIIPWVLYTNWKRRSKSNTNINNYSYQPTNSSFTEIGGYTPLPQQSIPPQHIPTKTPLTDQAQNVSQNEIEQNLMNYWRDQGVDPFKQYVQDQPQNNNQNIPTIEPLQSVSTEPQLQQQQNFEPQQPNGNENQSYTAPAESIQPEIPTTLAQSNETLQPNNPVQQQLNPSQMMEPTPTDLNITEFQTDQNQSSSENLPTQDNQVENSNQTTENNDKQNLSIPNSSDSNINFTEPTPTDQNK